MKIPRYRIKQVEFSKYDETDHLKRMKDSDILAEEYRSNRGHFASNVGAATKGATYGAIGGGIIGGLMGMRKGGGGFVSGIKKGLAGGALLGGAVGYHNSAKSNKQERESNNFYNDRLFHMKRQAMRRERADFLQNANHREGYTY